MWGRDGLYAGFCTGSGYPIAGDDHPSRSTVADALTRPTRLLGRTALIRSLSGLAPGGVYRAAPVTWGAGGLLHHLFTLTRTRRAVCFLWHYPAGFPEWALPTTLFCGARTFLGPLARHAIVQPSRPPNSLPCSRPGLGGSTYAQIVGPLRAERLPGSMRFFLWPGVDRLYSAGTCHWAGWGELFDQRN